MVGERCIEFEVFDSFEHEVTGYVEIVERVSLIGQGPAYLKLYCGMRGVDWRRQASCKSESTKMWYFIVN